MGIYDVPASFLIKEAAKDLKEKLEKPNWIDFVKSGSSREKAPQDRDFWFERNASILYRVYKEGPLGTESLRSYYGGRKNMGLRPERHKKAGGKIIRLCLQTLEKKGFIKKSKKGRVITGAGEKFLYAASKSVQKNIEAGVYVAKKKEIRSESDRKSRDIESALKGAEKKDRLKREEKKKDEKK